MLRLCKKCGSRLKEVSTDEFFITMQCSNNTCNEIYKFPVEKKVEEVKKEVEEEKFVINIPKFSQSSTSGSKEITVEQKVKVIKSASDDAPKTQEVNVTSKTNEDVSKEPKNINSVTKVVNVGTKESDTENNTTNQNVKTDEKSDKIKIETNIEKKVEGISVSPAESKNGNPDKIEKLIMPEGKGFSIKSDDVKAIQEKNNENKPVPEVKKIDTGNVKPVSTTNDSGINKNPVAPQAVKDNIKSSQTEMIGGDFDSRLFKNEPDADEFKLYYGEYDPSKLDLDAEDAMCPMNWTPEVQYISEENPDRKYLPHGARCPFCAGQKFAVTQKLSTCQDCNNKFLNQKFNSELYYAMIEAGEKRQKANFKEAESILRTIINRYQGEDLCDAYFALGIAQSNIIFRENIKTGKRFATVYEPAETPFLQNSNIKRALDIALMQSKIKYESLKKFADEIASSTQNFESIKSGNGVYTVFITYEQNNSTQDKLKGLLKSLSKTARTFVIGRINELIDDNNELMSKIYNGLNTSKIMILMISSRQDIMSSSVIWRYKTFLSVNREKHIIPVLINGFRHEDLPKDLQRFESIVWNDKAVLNIQKRIHQLLPNEYINDDYLEDKLNKIEDCLSEAKFVEAEMRCERLLKHFSENPYVYLYKLLAKNMINVEPNIARIHEDLKDNEDFINAKKYADEALLSRLIKYEISNNNLQKLRRKQANKEKRREKIVQFFTRQSMQYVYTTIIPALLGLIILLSRQPFSNIESIYLFIIAGVITLSTLVMIVACKFRSLTVFTMIAAVLFLFGATCLSRIDYINNHGALYSYVINAEQSSVCLVTTDTILNITKEDQDIVIPDQVVIYGKTYTVTELGESLFENSYGIRSIKIPKTVTKIDAYAFKNCDADILFEEGSAMIILGDYAFSGYVGEYIDKLPESLESIGDYAFSDCPNLYYELEIELEIPANVTHIGKYAFKDTYCDIVFSQSSKITRIDDYAFADYKGYAIEIPDSVKEIGKYAFANVTQVYTLTIPIGVTKIEASAFEGMNKLRELISPIVADPDASYVSSSIIATYFGGNEKLKDLNGDLRVIITNTDEKLPDYAFANCSKLSEVIIRSETLKEIGNYAFDNCSNLKIVIMNDNNGNINASIIKIGDYAFRNCISLDSIIKEGTSGKTYTNPYMIPSTLESLGAGAFENCEGLTFIIIPESLYDIGIDAFKKCSKLKNIYLIKYYEIDKSENRFSTKLVTGDALGKLLINYPNIYICQSLTTVINGDIEYHFYDDNGTQQTLTFVYSGKISEPINVNSSVEYEKQRFYLFSPKSDTNS